LSRAGRPTAVRSHILRPLWWLPVALGVAALLQIADVTTARAEDESFDRGFDLEAIVDGDYDGSSEVPLSYDNPLTGETHATAYLWGQTPPPEPGSRVLIEVDRNDPRDVVLAGDRYQSDSFWWYSLPALSLVVAFVMRLLHQLGTERLMASSGPSFAMLATIGGRRWPHGCQLHLYPLDAAPGSKPVCSVALHSTDGIPAGGPAFVAEVKGNPRPFGRTAARAGDTLLWPRARSFTSASRAPLPAKVAQPLSFTPYPLPPGDVRVSHLQRSALPLAALALSLVVAAVFTMVTLAGLRDARRLERDGVEVVATVVQSDPDDFSVGVEFRLPGRERLLTSRVPVDYPEDWDVGDRLPAVTDPADPQRIRFTDEPYDAVEPVVWGSIPLVLSALWLVLGLRWRRLEARATAGPWSPADAWIVGRRFLATAVIQTLEVAIVHPESPLASCVVRLPIKECGPCWGPWPFPRRLAISGTPTPGEPLAVRIGDSIIPAIGPARSARATEAMDRPAPPMTPNLG
jgi:hypothetical protein